MKNLALVSLLIAVHSGTGFAPAIPASQKTSSSSSSALAAAEFVDLLNNAASTTSATAGATTSTAQSVSDTIIAGGAAAVAAVAGIFATKQDGDAQSKAVEEEEELPKIDVSIPYNAAAKLAFDSYSGEASSKSFAKFEAMYLEKAVEEVKFKQWKKSVAAEEAAKEANLNSLQSKMDDFMKA